MGSEMTSLKQRLAQFPKEEIAWSGQGTTYCQSFPCKICSKPIGKNESRLVVTTRITFMRGDDEVDFYCVSCAKEIGHEFPKTTSKVESWKSTIFGIDKQIAKLQETKAKLQAKIAAAEFQK